MKDLSLIDNQGLSFKSNYSHIIIRKINDTIAMSFIRDSGEEVIETIFDPKEPYKLLATCSKYMFLSYLFCPKQERVLLVGLGGGAMTRFLRHYDPNVHIDVVEIDPVVIKLAYEYFGVKDDSKLNIIQKDGYLYLKDTELQYDAIYMDAFLKPTKETDITGAPNRLHTRKFYKTLMKKIKPNGLIIFNLNDHPGIEDALKVIYRTFPKVHTYRVDNFSNSVNVIAIASLSKKQEELSTLTTRAKELEDRFDINFSDMLKSEINRN